jgi:hypothetical protein
MAAYLKLYLRIFLKIMTPPRPPQPMDIRTGHPTSLSAPPVLNQLLPHNFSQAMIRNVTPFTANNYKLNRFLYLPKFRVLSVEAVMPTAVN